MDKKHFIDFVSKELKAEATEVEQVLDNFLELTSKTLVDGEKVSIAGFGTFTPKRTKARKTFSALLNREIDIPAKTKISFSTAKELAEEINKKFANLETKVIEENIKRKIEKKVPLITETPEEPSTIAKKFLDELEKKTTQEELSTESKKSFAEAKEEKEDLGLEEEVFETLISKESEIEKTETTSIEEETKKIKEEIKSEESTMPNMNLKDGGPKFVLGEEIRPSVGATSTFKKATSPTPSIPPSGFTQRENSSPMLWVTLIVLFIIIIGAGIYWALNTDVTQTGKKDIGITESQKRTTTPPVIVQDQKTKAVDTLRPGRKQIILMPEEYASVKETEKSVKEKEKIVVEEKKEPTAVEMKSTEVPVITELTKTEPSVTRVKKPITPKRKIPTTTTTVLPKTVEGASSVGDYFIQVYSYKNESYANAEAKNLRNKGYRAYVESANVPNLGTMYRVMVGMYKDEDAAAKDYHNLRVLLKSESIYVDRR